MRGMKRIAESGRAVCATIHQPSIAIFNTFDNLLLLKAGGDVVFFGELGEESSNLIRYLESYEATPKIRPTENPASWYVRRHYRWDLSGRVPLVLDSNACLLPFGYPGCYVPLVIPAVAHRLTTPVHIGAHHFGGRISQELMLLLGLHPTQMLSHSPTSTPLIRKPRFIF
jgi:hypothetical protein